MNNINPIHILTFLVVVIFLLFVKLSQTRDELSISKQQYDKTLEVVTKIESLQAIYNNKEETKKALQRVLRQSSLASSKIETKETRNNIIITSESMDKKALDSLMSKILNGVYAIDLVEIRRLSSEKVSLKLEIKW